MTDPIHDFRHVLEAAGLTPGEIVGDGQIKRCGTVGKERGQDGAYLFHQDSPASGWFQNYRTGVVDTWTSANGGRPLSDEERAKLESRIKKDKAARREAEANRHAEAKVMAKKIMDAAQPAPPENDYFQRKGVHPCDDLLEDSKGRLIVPVLDRDGTAQSLQFIAPDGSKRFLTGGKAKGGYFPILGNDGPLFVVEGLATGLSVHEATGQTVLVAFNAGNLKAVAEFAREKYPKREIIIVADNDTETKDNPGMVKGKEAALAVKGKVAVPTHPEDPARKVDFNDVHVLVGLDAVREQLALAREPEENAELPRPLSRNLAPGQDFPLEALGPILGDAARAIHETVQAPSGVAGNSVLAAASLAVQGLANVEIDGRVSPLSLFVLSVAESGGRKTSADNVALTPVHEFETELADKHRAEMPEYLDAKAAWDSARAAALKKQGKTYQERQALLKTAGPEPGEPLQPIITTDEPSFEGLCKLFLKGRPSLGIFTSEGGRLVGGYALKEENRLAMAAGLSALWDAQTVKRIRAGDGASTLRGRRLAAHVLIQPKAAWKLLGAEDLQDQGCLARFLLSWPESLIGSRSYSEASAKHDPRVIAYHRRLGDLLRTELPLREGTRNELDPPCLRLDQDAKALWVDFYNHVEGQCAEGGELSTITAFASKAPEHALRIAGVLALVEDSSARTINLESVRCGIELATHYINETLRVVDAASLPPELVQAEKLLNWIRNSWVAEQGHILPLSAVYQRGPSNLRTANDARTALKLLTEHGWVTGPTPAVFEGRKVREAWEVSPHV